MEKKQNYRYEIVFRTVYLDEDCEEIGTETEAVLFSKESGNALWVEQNIEYSELHREGRTKFDLCFRLPKEEWEEE